MQRTLPWFLHHHMHSLYACQPRSMPTLHRYAPQPVGTSADPECIRFHLEGEYMNQWACIRRLLLGSCHRPWADPAFTPGTWGHQPLPTSTQLLARPLPAYPQSLPASHTSPHPSCNGPGPLCTPLCNKCTERHKRALAPQKQQLRLAKAPPPCQPATRLSRCCDSACAEHTPWTADLRPGCERRSASMSAHDAV